MSNDNQLIDGLRGMGGAEPPLGFDPDRVADTAAKLHKRRRATIGASIGTLGLVSAVAISVAVVNPGEADQVAAAATTTTSLKPITPKPRPELVSPKVNLSKQKARNLEHLKQVLAQVEPGVTDVTAEMSQVYEDNDLDALSGTVEYKDSHGGAKFNLSITGPITAASNVTPLEEQCVPIAPPALPSGVTEQPRQEPERLKGKCEKLVQPDGSVVVAQEQLSLKNEQKTGITKNPDDYYLSALFTTHYRLDGLVVGTWNTTFVPSRFDSDEPGKFASRPEPALNREQAIKVVTDPGFNLK